jgi:hypothetical protein
VFTQLRRAPVALSPQEKFMATASPPLSLYYWPTPNGHKITLFLEETGLPYKTDEARQFLFGQDASTVRGH